MKTEYFSFELWNQTLGVWYIYISLVDKCSSFHHNLIVCISSITSWFIVQEYLHISFLGIHLCYLPARMVEFPSYLAGLRFCVGIICCNKKKSLTHTYAYLHRLQLLSCALRNLIQGSDLSHLLFFTHPSEPTKRKGNVREIFETIIN